MAYLLDTNILIISINPQSSMYSITIQAIKKLKRNNERLYITSQNLIEFWNVYTRPISKNGLGHTPKEAEAEINKIKSYYQILTDTPEIYRKWEELVIKYNITGIQVYDNRLVAIMLTYKIKNILTFNKIDFQFYTEIPAVSPRDI